MNTLIKNLPLMDSHCHIDMVLQKKQISWQDFSSEVSEANIKKIIHIASDSEAFDFALSYKNQSADFDFFYTIGQHPAEVHEVDAWQRLKQARELQNDKSFVAIGEVGLDYYYGSNTSDLQKKVFSAYIDLAMELKKPLTIHTRDAHQDTLELLKPAFGKVPVIIHCFTGNRQQMQDYLNRGAYISFSGIVTFKNAKDLQEAAIACPANRLLIETDAPFLAPIPQRGKINTSAFLPYTFDFLCNLRQETNAEEFSKQIWNNIHHSFLISS